MSNIKLGDVVKAQITGITKYGVFVSLEDDYVGMIHISEVSYKFVRDLNELFEIGQIIGVKILEIDENKRRVKLSIKSMKPRMPEKDKNIKEQGTGFGMLRDNLDIWVRDKIDEFNVGK